ncbi:hypothetical protein A4E84_36930 [Streptomyces qaidamensis]|uniref:Uncharacterized protein n=1 Tax=Streptomyces qaidamensis TaxID=1783515 RepID=A0A143CAV5_9ACTN|nr:hypothetical protein [Streptomyces qaidamensis]AMW14574.1 hypothetical protein A4E84_36930 [Streptomyces qaidamensis]
MVSEPVVRVVWGATLTLFPDVLLHRLLRTPPGRTGRTAVRALGVRHVLQGAAPTRGLLSPAWRTALDASHAVSMAGLALRSERWRGAALTDLCVACAFTLSSVRGARAGRVGDGHG